MSIREKLKNKRGKRITLIFRNMNHYETFLNSRIWNVFYIQYSFSIKVECIYVVISKKETT